MAGVSFGRELLDEWGWNSNLVGPFLLLVVVIIVVVVQWSVIVSEGWPDRIELYLVADSIELAKFRATSWKFQRSSFAESCQLVAHSRYTRTLVG